MPWVAGDAKRHKKGLNPSQAAKWAKIANGVLKSCKATGGSDCEGKAIRIANSKFDLVDINSTWTFDDLDAHDAFFGLTRDDKGEPLELATDPKKKPGGSNAGEYNKGPFCGPSGGAPKGTYPVNTRARARAAIAYARHAPNPAGIKACVCRHYGDLPSCKKKKGSDAMIEQPLPKGSLRFDGGGKASVVFQEVEGGAKRPKLKMVAYSGGIIQNHWYWGNLGIDLQGMKFAKDRYPLLANHDTDRRLAHMGKPVIENNQLKAPEDDVVFLDNEDAQKFLAESEKGFPFQASIYAKPSKIVRLEEGDEHPCNGFMVKGPGAVWLESEFREMSACVFGADSNTSAAAFSENDYEACAFAEVDATGKAPVQTNEKEVKVMEKEQFMKDHADLYAEIVAEIKAQFSAPAENVEIKAMKDEVAQLRDENKALKKENDVRREKELKAEAAAIFVAKLSASEIPDRLHDKVQAMVDFNKFVKDQVLDTKAFGEAVDAEIKSWIDRGVTVKAAVVLGEGTVVKGDETAEKKEQNTKLSERLLSHVGQTKK